MAFLKSRYGTNAESNGFTLIELLVVISIISVLASIILTNVADARRKANDARRISDVRSMVSALQLAREKYGHYPCTSGQLSSYTGFLDIVVEDGFLTDYPKDPINSGAFVYFYATYKDNPDGQCGASFQISYDIESRGTPCLFGGKMLPEGDPNAVHCHVFYPQPLACSDPYLVQETPATGDCALIED